MRTFTVLAALPSSMGVAFPPLERSDDDDTYVLEGELDIGVLQGELHVGHHGLLHL